PEILVVDEVLAVGDAQFQKRCLGKMQEVSRLQGRTVLFVSHNMTAVRSLCSRALLLERGQIAKTGGAGDVANAYLQQAATVVRERSFDSFASAPGTDWVRIKLLRAVPELDGGMTLVTVKTPIRVECEFWNQLPGAQINLSLSVNGLGEE